MKRMVALLLAVLLTGCTVQPAATVPATEPTPTVQPPREYSVTAGGISVRTDYSAYTTEKQTVTPNFTRLTDAPMPDLTARDDYGALYPFLAEAKRGDYDDNGSYAFADVQGRVVTDAVYGDVRQLRNADRTQGVWLYRKPQTQEGEIPRYGFATLDGSFVTDCRYWRVCAGRRFLMCIYPADALLSGATRFDVYDYGGKLLTTSDKLPYADRLSTQPTEFGCAGDYLAVALRDGEYDDFNVWNEYPFPQRYLADPDGTLCHGPYYHVTEGAGGFLAVDSAYPETFGAVLRPDGSNLFGRKFYEVSVDAADRFTVKDGEFDDKRVLDAAGNEIFSVSDDTLFWVEGYYATQNSDDGGPLPYDRDGNPMPEVREQGWFNVSGTPLFFFSETGVAKLRNVATDEEITVNVGDSGYVTHHSYRCTAPFPYVFVTVGGERDFRYYQRNVVLYDERLQPVLRFRGFSHMVCDSADETPYLVVHADGKQTLYDAALKPIAALPEGRSGSFAVYGGIITCCNDRASYIYDSEGNELLCYPLYGLLDD